MAENFPIIQAPAAIKKLQETFPDNPADETAFFSAFEEVCTAFSGEPFAGFPETFPAADNGPTTPCRLHIARFYKEGSLSAYTAALHDLESDTYTLTHDMDGATWPTWLDTYLKYIEDLVADLRTKHASYPPNDTLH